LLGGDPPADGADAGVPGGDAGIGGDPGYTDYINFIVAIEAELKIKFRIADVESFATVGDIVAGAKALLGGRR